MLRTPLKLVKRSYVTPSFMWILMAFVYGNLSILFFPRKFIPIPHFIINWHLVYQGEDTLILVQFSLFFVTLFFHLMAVCTDPGYIKRPPTMDFFTMLKEFDPILLCPDCEVIRTDRSRHCSICNKCVERFDHHCPWINGCVGIRNHGFFMCFLLSMLALLVTTFVSLVINYDAIDHIYDGHDFFYKFILPEEAYLKVSFLFFCHDGS